MCSSDPQVVMLPTTGTEYDTSLPLHLLILGRINFEPLSREANIFRLLLRLYPAAANIKDEMGLTPYDMTNSCNLDSYFQRLLLRADMSIKPQQLFRLNYDERRMALFISSGKAIFESTSKYNIWRILWLENKDMLNEVVSYLEVLKR